MHLPPGDEAILFLDCFATSWLAMTGLVDLLITLDCYGAFKSVPFVIFADVLLCDTLFSRVHLNRVFVEFYISEKLPTIEVLKPKL